jgi:hypothetical protein
MRAELGDYPNRDHVLGDATHLAERSETFEAFLAQDPSPERVRTAYASINDVATCLHNDLSRRPPPAAVQASWRSFSQSQHSIHEILDDLPAPPPTALAPLPPPPPQPPQPPALSPQFVQARQTVAVLRQRAEVMVASMREQLGNYPARDHVLSDATQLIQRSESFEAFLGQNPAARAGPDGLRVDQRRGHLPAQRPEPAAAAGAGAGGLAVLLADPALDPPGPGRPAGPAADGPCTAPPAGGVVQAVSPQVANARRISLALHQRAEVLVATMRTDLQGYANAAHVVQDAHQIVGQTEAFQEFLAQNPSPEQIRVAYAPIGQFATCLQGDLTRQPPPPSVLGAWQSFAQAQYLIHDALQLPPPAPTVRVVLRPPSGPSPVVGLTDQLVAETEAFLRVFGPTVRVVPEGRNSSPTASACGEPPSSSARSFSQGYRPEPARPGPSPRSIPSGAAWSAAPTGSPGGGPVRTSSNSQARRHRPGPPPGARAARATNRC